MADYPYTQTFTLVPQEMKEALHHRYVMKELFDIENDVEVHALALPQYGATLLYCLPEIAGGKGHGAGSNGSPLEEPEHAPEPAVYILLQKLSALAEYNKVIVDYHPLGRYTAILVAEGERLVTATGYRTPDFGTAVYFLLEALGRSQMNARQTVVNLYGKVAAADIQLLGKYVKECRCCSL